MIKKIKIICLVLLFIILITIIYLKLFYKYNFYSSLIGVKIPLFTKFEEKDTHGGFHGDGESLVKVYFSNKQSDDFINKINENKNWKEMPININLNRSIIYKNVEGNTIPNVKNGYWLFIDRHSNTVNKYEYNESLTQASFNYSIAIFDIDTNILYIYSLDT